MKRYYRIEYEGAPRHAVEENGAWRLVEGSLFGPHRAGPSIDPRAHRVLAPIVPSKIVAIGLNYKDHAVERNKPLPAEPLMFLKPSTAVVGPGEPIVLAENIGRVDHEAELGVVIGAEARYVSEQDAPRYVFGFTCVNDISARELQTRDGQFTRAKGFDSFAPVGPCIAVGLDYHAPAGLMVEAFVNGERRQHSSTRELIFPIDLLIAFVTNVMTLLPGDIIATGTPAGVGPIVPGDRVTIKIEGVGELTNPVALAVRVGA